MSQSHFLNDSYPGPGLADPEAPEREAAAPEPAPPASWFTELIRVAFPPQPSRPAATILFAAPNPGCGVSYLATAIACELAATGSQAKVLLADAETLLTLTNRENPIPLCERIESASESAAIWVLGPTQLTAAKRIAKHTLTPLDALKQEFTHILIDAPALSTGTAALRFATQVDGVILIAAAHTTETRQIQHLHRKLTSLGARVLGSIYNAY